MMGKIRRNYGEHACYVLTRHLDKNRLSLLALVFLTAIPSPLYWALVLLYAFYLAAPNAGLRFAADETNVSSSGSSSRRANASVFSGKRFQQIWFAVKRYSPIHRPKPQQGSQYGKQPRKHSISENEHLVHDNTGGACKLSWSPFAKRKQRTKKRYGLYSSHPDISSNHLNEEVEFLQEANNSRILLDEEGKALLANSSSPSSTRWDPHSILNRSPLSRIKKIKRDMQRCVNRTTSSDYELSDPNGDPTASGGLNRLANCQADQVQVLTSKSPSKEASPPALASKSNSVTPDKRRRLFQKSVTIDKSSFEGEELEEDSVPVGLPLTESNARMPDIAIPTLDKVQNYESILQRQKISKLLKFPFYQVDIHLRSAANLLAKDACGTSDPYVKFKIANQVIHKSRTIDKTLNPKWDEYFVVPVDDIFEPLVLKLFDRDLLFMDDYLGSTHIDLTKLEPGIATELELFLHETDDLEKANIDESWGKVYLTVKLNPKTQEEKEHFYGRGKWVTSYGADGPCKKVRTQAFDSVVYVMLIKGDHLCLETDYCIKFKLANEKYKSKVVSKSVQSPYWAEPFDLRLYADQSKVLEITLCGANQSASDFIEKTCIDLSELSTEKSHYLPQKFNIDQRCIELLVTITGSQTGPANISSNNLNCPITRSKTYSEACKKYNIFHSLKDLSDIGHLIVKVYKAENLAAADINGKSDPFCVLELVNDKLRTGTEYKTLCPEWNKVFSFNIKDIHEVLEVTVYDEDKDSFEFLGKVAIPLLKIKSGEKRWYALKDKKLSSRVKGHILLEFWISYNEFKASVRTLTPREPKYVQPEIKFKRALFVRNAIRLKNVTMELFEWGQFMQSCIQWESPTRSLVAFIFCLSFVYFFDLYMIPLLLLLILTKNYTWLKIESYFNPNRREEEIEFIDENAFDELDDEKAEEKKSLKEKLQTVQEISAVVMNIIGEIASFIERIKNTSNFSVPFLSWLAVICLTLATLILYKISIRYLVLLFLINKFTKKFRAPDAINNNELLDFLSRVPDIEQKIMYKEFKPNVAESKGNQQSSPSHGGGQSTANLTGQSGSASTTGRGSSLAKSTSFKSQQSTTSMESASDKKKKKTK